MMGDSNVLGKAQLQKLLEHKYTAQGSSIAEVFLQPFWRYVVEFMPLWLAPNTITILGLAVNIITSALIMYICPFAVGEVCIFTSKTDFIWYCRTGSGINVFPCENHRSSYA